MGLTQDHTAGQLPSSHLDEKPSLLEEALQSHMSLVPAQFLAQGSELQEQTGTRGLRSSRQEGSWGKNPEVLTLYFCPLPGSSQPEA